MAHARLAVDTILHVAGVTRLVRIEAAIAASVSVTYFGNRTSRLPSFGFPSASAFPAVACAIRGFSFFVNITNDSRVRKVTRNGLFQNRFLALVLKILFFTPLSFANLLLNAALGFSCLLVERNLGSDSPVINRDAPHRRIRAAVSWILDKPAFCG